MNNLVKLVPHAYPKLEWQEPFLSKGQRSVRQLYWIFTF